MWDLILLREHVHENPNSLTYAGIHENDREVRRWVHMKYTQISNLQQHMFDYISTTKYTFLFTTGQQESMLWLPSNRTFSCIPPRPGEFSPSWIFSAVLCLSSWQTGVMAVLMFSTTYDLNSSHIGHKYTHRVGRRPLLFCGSIGMLFSMFGIALYLVLTGSTNPVRGDRVCSSPGIFSDITRFSMYAWGCASARAGGWASSAAFREVLCPRSLRVFLSWVLWVRWLWQRWLWQVLLTLLVPPRMRGMDVHPHLIGVRSRPLITMGRKCKCNPTR